MGLFGPPDVEKMKRNHDQNGLIKALKYKDVAIQGKAARALGELGDKSAIPALEACFDALRREMWRTEGRALQRGEGAKDARERQLVIIYLNDVADALRALGCDISF